MTILRLVPHVDGDAAGVVVGPVVVRTVVGHLVVHPGGDVEDVAGFENNLFRRMVRQMEAAWASRPGLARARCEAGPRHGFSLYLT